jgi:hypothetical protein
MVIFLILAVLLVVVARATDNTELSQSITGVLDIKIVDAGGNEVSDPSVAFPSRAFSMLYQSSTATLGVSAQRMRVTNPTDTDTWTLNMAAADGATDSWSNGTSTYDFNDPTASAGDGSDTDSVGGQLTVDPSAGTIAGVGGTSTSNVSLGASDAFNEETNNNSIDLMTASSGAQAPGQWDLTGVSLSQTIPGGQATGNYTIGMVLTAS